MNTTDIIIIGAGAAGLVAARELSKAGKKVIILEARKRLGGRIYTFKDKKFTNPTEAGAEFVHGKLETTLEILKEYEIEYSRTEGQIWHIRKGEPEKDKDLVPDHHRLLNKKLKAIKRDVTVKQFLEKHFKGVQYAALRQSVTGFVEGYESAGIDRFSTIAFREDWLEVEEWKQYRVEKGYGALINSMADECKAYGCEIRLNAIVKKIKWKKNIVEVFCLDGKTYNASQAVITVPLGLLQKKQIQFIPALTTKTEAFNSLGFGDVIKILLLFKTKFWQEKSVQKRLHENLDKLFFMFSQETVPVWWTQYPATSALLTGWFSGPDAKKWSSETDRQIMEEALQSLSLIFETDKETLRSKLKSWKVVNWSKDPFTLGSYSFATVNAKKYRTKAGSAEKNTLFFAGEHLAEPTGTVEGALKSGLKVAGQIVTFSLSPFSIRARS